MRRREFLNTLGGGLVGLGLGGFARAAAPAGNRPGIVVMMADDMGFSDLGCYGGEIRTPNLDGLAANGLRFTQFYNTARCCPTRASLLTGLYPHQAGVGHMMEDHGFDAYRGNLNRRCVTIAEVLRGAGYGTCMAGKWHVSRFSTQDGPKDNWPCQRGFDRYFGTIVGAGSYWHPTALTRDNALLEDTPDGFYYTTALGDAAATFITEHHAAKPDVPLFLYLAFTSPHWPLHAPKSVVDSYRGSYRRGWDAVRRERHARQVAMGLVDPKWDVSPRDPTALKWDDLTPGTQDELDWRMSVYAAQIDCMDQAIGKVIDALRAAGRLDHTLVLFLADNGGCAEGGPGGFERNKGGVLGEDSSFASYGLSWANASNTPFRYYKHYVHEGGISTPLIAHWPAGIRERNALRSEPGHLIDIMATCVDISGAAYPAEAAGIPIQPMEGRSLRPVFDGGTVEREAIYWEHEGNRAVRQGPWKLVSRHPGGWELYDLLADRTEQHDLAAAQPERVTALTALWQAWATRAGVQPWPIKGGTPLPLASKERVFELKQGEELEMAKAPGVTGREITITASVDLPAAGANGVILAHGGNRVGYAFYVKDGRLAWTLRRDGDAPDRVTTLLAPLPLPAGRVQVAGRLGKDGTITLSANGAEIATAKAPGPVNDMPHEPLGAGLDPRSAVGDYTAPNPFPGTIQSLRLELGE